MTDNYSQTPVYPIEQARAGWKVHIGKGQFATRCPKCDTVIVDGPWVSAQRHLSEAHNVTAAMLP